MTALSLASVLTEREAAQIVSDSGAGVMLYHSQFAQVGTAAARAVGIPAYDVAGLGESRPVGDLADRHGQPAGVRHAGGDRRALGVGRRGRDRRRRRS